MAAEMPFAPTRYTSGFFRQSIGCGEHRPAGASSQSLGFPQNSATKQPVETVLGHDIYRAAEQTFQFLNEPGWEPRACRFTCIDQQINVAVSSRFATNDGTEDTHISGSVPVSNAQDLVTAIPKKDLDGDG